MDVQSWKTATVTRAIAQRQTTCRSAVKSIAAKSAFSVWPLPRREYGYPVATKLPV